MSVADGSRKIDRMFVRRLVMLNVTKMSLSFAEGIRHAFTVHKQARDWIAKHGCDPEAVIDGTLQWVQTSRAEIMQTRGMLGVWKLMVDKLPTALGQQAHYIWCFRLLEEDDLLNVSSDYDKCYAFCFCETSTGRYIALPLPYPLEAGQTFTTNACQNCGARDLQLYLCGRCMCTRYCSKACQLKDRTNQKEFCGEYKKKDSASR